MPARIFTIKEDKFNERRGFSTFISEALGTFVFVLFFMISTDKKTRYSKDKTLNCLVIAASYVAS